MRFVKNIFVLIPNSAIFKSNKTENSIGNFAQKRTTPLPTLRAGFFVSTRRSSQLRVLSV
jgi:hypothetical protein